MAAAEEALKQAISKSDKELLTEWMASQLAADTIRTDLMKETELREQSREFLGLVHDAIRNSDLRSTAGAAWEPVKDFLAGISKCLLHQTDRLRRVAFNARCAHGQSCARLCVNAPPY
jgi:rsbT co-antagonist protein RsbR